MKARYLKALLGTTRPTAEYEEYIAVGSPLCHNLLTVDKKTLAMRFALTDSWLKDHRKYLTVKGDEELLAIWDKLAALIESGEIRDIIAGHDDIPEEHRITIWVANGSKIEETYTDIPEWPNTTYDGKMLYSNTTFTDKTKAAAYAISSAWGEIRSVRRELKSTESRLEMLNGLMAEARTALAGFLADGYIAAGIEPEDSLA